MKKSTKISLFVSLSLIVIVAIASTVYVNDYYHGTPNAYDAMESNASVTVEENNDYVSFTPSVSTDKGILFFQGGKVDHIAYAPYMQDFANEGYLSLLVISPFRLAMFGTNAAKNAMYAFPEIDEWTVIGHSLGGVIGSNFAFENSEKVTSMVFLASYPLSDFNQIDTRVLSITASEDSVLNQNSFDEAETKLNPDLTTYVEISGGNHGQFGDYGVQAGDGVATISPQEQRTQVVNAVIDWLN